MPAQGVTKLDLGDGVDDWTAESGQTVDIRFMGTSHVGFSSFDCRCRTSLTDVTDFDIGTTLRQGMRRDHIGRFHLLT